MRSNRQPILEHLQAQLHGRARLPEGHPVRRFDARCVERLDERQRHAAFRMAIHVLKRYPLFLVAKAPAGAELERACFALVELAQMRGRFVRAPGDIALSRKGVLQALSSLASGLLTRWPVPRWAHNVYLRPAANADLAAVLPRVGQGESLRRVFQAVPLSKRAAHILQAETPNLDVAAAVRFAQVRALGFTEVYARKVAGTVLGARLLSEPEERFIAHLFAWLVTRPAMLDVQLEPMLGWAQMCFADDPAFSFKGRTARSVTRAVARYVDVLEDAGSGGEHLDYAPALNERVLDREGVRWRFRPIRSSASLFREAEQLRHCVFTYGDEAAAGTSTLISLVRELDGGGRRALTIEVASGEVTEVRGRCNRVAREDEAAVVRAWAAELGLTFGGEVELPAAQ